MREYQNPEPWELTKRCRQAVFIKCSSLQKSETLLGSLYRQGKVSRNLRVQELKYTKYILYKKIKCIS